MKSNWKSFPIHLLILLGAGTGSAIACLIIRDVEPLVACFAFFLAFSTAQGRVIDDLMNRQVEFGELYQFSIMSIGYGLAILYQFMWHFIASKFMRLDLLM